MHKPCNDDLIVNTVDVIQIQTSPQLQLGSALTSLRREPLDLQAGPLRVRHR